MSEGVRGLELRVLDGPNLYFGRPAIKLTLAVGPWIRASEARVEAVAQAIELSGSTEPGPPGSAERRRFVARIAAQLTRRMALASGARRLAVRGRPGRTLDEIVVAFPWRRRGAAEALAREAARGMAAILRRSPRRWIAEAAGRLADVEPGPAPSVPDPVIPVIQVTGTNGKTTTVRLLAHIVRTSGRTVAYSSTDGVYAGDGELIQAGDYSGFGGAGMALAAEPDIAVLESARGGLLQRGSGVLHNDVSVVTNVSADHLGLHGIDTVDQLAEVKGLITQITRPDGWVVLNADDPRVLAMQRRARGRRWLCSLDPDHPALHDVLRERGRAMTVLDGQIAWIEGHGSHRLLPLEDVPMTLAGLSTTNAHNALSAAAAALAIGIEERAVTRGLRTFVPDPERNPGRANLFRIDGRLVLIDYAHNEAGMMGLTTALRGLCPPGSRVWLAICTAGDRTDEILHAFAFRAAVGSDHLAIADLLQYLRGRTREDITERLREGAREAGVDEVAQYDDELQALREMVEGSRRGDVVSVTALSMRPEIFEWLASRGARHLGPAEVRRVVRRVRAARTSGAGGGSETTR